MRNGQWYGKNEIIEMIIEICCDSLYVTIPTDDIIKKTPFRFCIMNEKLNFNIKNFMFYLKYNQELDVLHGTMRSNHKFGNNITQNLILQPLTDEFFLNNSYKTRMEKLAESNNYKFENCTDIKLTKILSICESGYYKEIRFKMNMILSENSDFFKALKIMNEVCKKYRHNGRKIIGTRQNFFSLDKFASENGYFLNCRGLALILEDVLCAYHIPARAVTCMQFEKESYDCHVCVELYDLAAGKWIFLDPSYNLYICDSKNKPLGLREIKTALINNIPIFSNKEAKYLQYSLDFPLYLKILIKKLCRFSVENYHINGREKVFDGKVELVCESLVDHSKQMISNPEYFWRSPYEDINIGDALN